MCIQLSNTSDTGKHTGWMYGHFPISEKEH